MNKKLKITTKANILQDPPEHYVLYLWKNILCFRYKENGIIMYDDNSNSFGDPIESVNQRSLLPLCEIEVIEQC